MEDTSGPPTQEPDQPSPVRFFPLLSAIGAVLGLGRIAFVGLWEKYIVLPNLSPFSSASPLSALEFGSVLGTFLIWPCLMFLLYYRFGRGVDLAANLRAASVSLLLGGTVGAVLGFFSNAIIYNGPDGAYSFFASLFANGWALGQLVVAVASAGVFTLFVGVAAVVIGARGTHVRPAPHEEPAESSP